VVVILLVVAWVLQLRRRAAARGPEPFESWWCRVRAAWRWLRRWLARRDQPEPARIYQALLRWGARSGSPHRASETPLEYAGRLQLRIPALRESFN
jgi:hypothetical protein